eukprot:5367304-Amphidinium_carterae.1
MRLLLVKAGCAFQNTSSWRSWIWDSAWFTWELAVDVWSMQALGRKVVWQLCSTTIGEPDLVRVAEMDTMATEKQRFEVQMRLLRACLHCCRHKVSDMLK